jgi:initiation factor 1A
MVRNITGGNGSKGLARKDQTKGSSHIQLSTDELEQYACVTKAFGNGMVEIYTNDNVRLIGHIRNKFRGKNKRNNLITVDSIVLVGLRDYEKPPKNCDILTVYDQMQVEQLRLMPNLKIDNILKLSMGKVGNSSTARNTVDVNFIEDDDEMPEPTSRNKTEEQEFELIAQEEVDIEDI